ncbi:MAG: CatB-related O-acetyltransferase [Candidatus Delongbacteria bacterium]|nr:CatB-related O-acetyltransferase [Candidatus Delongbacteria bacterium]MBN2836854.1 CatB-related O-acetyltransferase [Candidatus Delongbacteria bacterium]
MKTYFGGYNKIHNDVEVYYSWIGIGTYIASNSKLSSSCIGKFCSIGPNISIIKGQHPTKDFVSTHPAFFSLLKEQQAGFNFVDSQYFEDFKFADKDNNYSIVIGNDVWIGANVLILEGVTIGDGVIVAAGSVVTKDLLAYGIYGGVPAKLIRMRFNEEVIQFFKNFRWWNKEISWIRDNSLLFHDVKKFIEVFKGEK